MTIIYTAIKPATLQALLLHAAKQDVRYYLNGIMYDGVAGKLVATDGHRIITIDIRDKNEAKFIIPRKLVEQALKVFGKEEYLDVEYNSEGLEIRIKGLVGKAIDGKFPDYDTVTGDEKYDTAMSPAAFNPLFLLDAMYASNLLNGIRKNHPVAIRMMTRPVKVDLDYNTIAEQLAVQSATHYGKKFQITIMPLRA